MQLGTVESLVTVGIVCLGAIAVGVWFWMRRSPNPEERERQRRLAVSRTGRMTDALLTDVRDTTACYTFSARGMTYMASQDISMFLDRLPEDRPIVGRGGIWLLWPKKGSAIQTDLTRSVVRKIGMAAGLVDYKISAIDETWAGLRFTVRGRGSPGSESKQSKSE